MTKFWSYLATGHLRTPRISLILLLCILLLILVLECGNLCLAKATPLDGCTFLKNAKLL